MVRTTILRDYVLTVYLSIWLFRRKVPHQWHVEMIPYFALGIES